MRIATLPVALLVTAAALAACGDTEDEPATSPTAASEESAADEEMEEASEESSEVDEPAEATTDQEVQEEETSAAADEAESADDESGSESGATFGSAVQVSDGMTVTISEPEEFTPSSTDFLSGEWETFVRMDVLVENTGEEPLEAFNVYTRATTGSQAAEEVYDYEQGLETPSAVIQPGRELEYAIGYGVSAGEPFDLTVEDVMDFSSQGVTLSTVIE